MMATSYCFKVHFSSFDYLKELDFAVEQKTKCDLIIVIKMTIVSKSEV